MRREIRWSAVLSFLVLAVAMYARPVCAQTYYPHSSETLYYALDDTDQSGDPVGSRTVLCDSSVWILGEVTTNKSRTPLECDPIYQSVPVGIPGGGNTFWYWDCTQVIVDGVTHYSCVMRVY